MAGQHPTRRQVLEALGYAAAASAALGLSKWRYAFAENAPQHAMLLPADQPAGKTEDFQPAFFTPAEYLLVQILADLILPGKQPHDAAAPRMPEHAGASDAGVAEFIDFMVAQDASLQASFRQGLAWMNGASGPNGFASIPQQEQHDLLDRVAYRKNYLPEERTGQQFFAHIRKLTVMGFYTSRIGLASIDYPGLRFYAQSPSVPQDAFLQSLHL